MFRFRFIFHSFVLFLCFPDMRRGVKNTLRVWTGSSLCSQATVGCSGEWKLTGSRRLDRLRPFDIPLWSASRSDLPRPTHWTDRARNAPVGRASNSQTCANCRWSGDRSIIQSLFFHPQSPVPKEGPVGHYRVINSEILVWTSGGKLMCYCDERFFLSVWGSWQRAQSGEIRSADNCQSWMRQTCRSNNGRKGRKMKCP